MSPDLQKQKTLNYFTGINDTLYGDIGFAFGSACFHLEKP
jgi:hypothetical protein